MEETWNGQDNKVPKEKEEKGKLLGKIEIAQYKLLGKIYKIKGDLTRAGILPRNNETIDLENITVNGVEYAEPQIHCSTVDKKGKFRDGILLFLTAISTEEDDGCTIVIYFIPNRSDFIVERPDSEIEEEEEGLENDVDQDEDYKPGELYCTSDKIVIGNSLGDVVNINYHNRKGFVKNKKDD